MGLSDPVHQGELATGRGFLGARVDTIGVLKGDSHVLEQVFSALHQYDAIKRGMFTHGTTDSISSYHKLSKKNNKCKIYSE